MKILLSLLILLPFLTGCPFTDKVVDRNLVAQNTPTGGQGPEEQNSIPDSDQDGLNDLEEESAGTNPFDPDTDDDGLDDGTEIKTTLTDPKNPDTDGGGIKDGLEVNRGGNPLDPGDDIVSGGDGDADGDGLKDDEEVLIGTDPNDPDTDGDGLKDGAETNTFQTDPLDPDTDNGGVDDGPEVFAGTQPANNPDDDQVVVLDGDDDGLSDDDEIAAGTDPANPDTDGDGLKDGTEVNLLGTDPLDADTDDGGVNDGDEVNSGTNPLDASDDSIDGKDSDKDGLKDVQEIVLGTDPNNPDSDDDGLGDGAEVQTHKTDPLDSDTDDGGEKDGDEVSAGRNPLVAADDVVFQALPITLLTFPSLETFETDGEFVFTTADNSRVRFAECAIDSTEDFLSCSPNSPFTFTDLEVGEHKFTVRVTDTDGFTHDKDFTWIINEKPDLDPCSENNSTILTQLVSFPAVTQVCEFKKNGNGRKRDQRLQAVRSQLANISVPTGHKICSLDVKIDSQSIRYDDHFALTLNDVALMSNADYILSYGPLDLKVFNFQAVKGKRWKYPEVPFCFGANNTQASSCSMPKTDQNGSIKLTLSETQRQFLADSFTGFANQEIGFHVLGDNDSTDCQHTGLNLTVKIKHGPLNLE